MESMACKEDANKTLIDINNKGNEEIDEQEREQKAPSKSKNLLQKMIEKCENMILFSILYIHSSPLESLIGPGHATKENHVLVHTCYFVILSFIPAAFLIASIPSIRSYIGRDVNLCVFVKSATSCVEIVSNILTNRFSFAVASLFMFMALITMKCFARNEYTRPSLNNGFWILKLTLIFVVMLIAFSIPPALFDMVWQYVSSLATLVQSIFVTFFLLDWTNSMFMNSHNMATKNQAKTRKNIVYAFTLILLLLSTVAVTHTSYNSLKEKEFTWMDVLSLFLPIKFVISVFFFVQRDANSIAQSSVILSFLMLRLGLSLSYGGSFMNNQSAFQMYLFMDTFIKLIIVLYGLFRELQPYHYRYCCSTIYGSSHNITNVHEHNLGHHQKEVSAKCRKVSEIDGQGAAEELAKKLQDTLNKAQAINKKAHEYREKNDEESLKPRPVSGKNNQQNQLCNKEYEYEKVLATVKSSSSAQSYSYTFLHIFLFTTCLDLNSNLTSFHLVTETGNNFEVEISLFSVLILKMTTAVIMVVYLWTRIVHKIYENVDEFSVFMLLVTLAKSTAALLYKVMVEPPCFAASAFKIRYVYAGIFASSMTVSFVVICPAVKMRLEKNTLFCSYRTKQGVCLSADPSLVALYRISISIAVFFLLMAALLLGVSSLANPRNKLHFGFWPTKALSLAITFFTTLYIPEEVGSIWKHMGLAATLLITLLQVIIVLDCASQAIDYIRNHEECSAKRTNQVFLSCSSVAVILYTIALTAFFCFYVYFAQFSICKSNRIFICINLGLCIMASMISLHPAVQDGGLVQSAIVTSFCMYCTWTALYNNPREECNPMAHDIFETDMKPTKTTLFIVNTIVLVATTAYVTVYTARIQAFLKRFAAVCFHVKCWRSGERLEHSISLQRLSFQHALLGHQYKHVAISLDKNQSNASPLQEHQFQEKKDDLKEADPTPYNYFFFHFVYALLSMHLFVLLITWTEERPGSHIKISFHWAVMCIKIVASSACVLLYIWSLVAHLFLHTSYTS